MKKLQSRILAIVLVIAVAGAYMPISEVPTYAATKKVKLSKKEVNLKVGKKKTVKLKNVSKKVKWKVVKGKKVVSIKKKGKLKNKIVIKAKKAGKAVIKATYNKKKYKVKVTVKNNKGEQQTSGNAQTSTTVAPTTANGAVITTTVVEPKTEVPTEAPTVAPTEASTEAPTEAPTAAPTEAPTAAPTTVVPTEKITEDTTTTRKEFYEEPETEVHPKNINVDNYMKQIDTSSSTSIKTSANEGIEKLFDGDINTKLCTSDGFPLRISWQMKKPIILKKYTLTTANDSETYSYRNPKLWHLYGSNNGTSWTQIDTVTDSGIEAKNSKAYTYETDIQESYQYYLIQFEGNGTNYYGFQLAEISLNGDVADVDKEMGEDLSSYYDSIFASATTAKGNGNETPFNLFDGRKESKLFEFSNQFSIAWKMKQDTTLYSYSLTTANDNETYKGRNPKSWILYGSSDGTNWEKIDTVNNSGMEDVNFKTYNYTVDKVGSYRYYKLDIKAGYGSSVQLSEISLKGAYISPSKYDILFTGDWKDVTVDGYLEELTKLFYNSYPRL